MFGVLVEQGVARPVESSRNGHGADGIDVAGRCQNTRRCTEKSAKRGAEVGRDFGLASAFTRRSHIRASTVASRSPPTIDRTMASPLLPITSFNTVSS